MVGDAKVLIGKLARDLPLMVKYLPSLMPLVAHRIVGQLVQLENLKLALELNEGKLGLEGMRRAIELRLVSQQQPLELIPALVDPVLPLCLRRGAL